MPHHFTYPKVTPVVRPSGAGPLAAATPVATGTRRAA